MSRLRDIRLKTTSPQQRTCGARRLEGRNDITAHPRFRMTGGCAHGARAIRLRESSCACVTRARAYARLSVSAGMGQVAAVPVAGLALITRPGRIRRAANDGIPREALPFRSPGIEIVTDKLWEIGDIVKVLEDWEVASA